MKKKERISSALRNRLKAHGVTEIDGSVTLKKVYERHQGRCQQCGRQTVYGVHPQVDSSATIEHIVPISRGGTHTWENVSLLCFKCNSGRNHASQSKTVMKEKRWAIMGIEISVRWRAA